jgi:hypothetical protein
LKTLQNLPGITPLTRLLKNPLCAAVEALPHASCHRGPALLTRLEEIPFLRPRPLAPRRCGSPNRPTPLLRGPPSCSLV